MTTAGQEQIELSVGATDTQHSNLWLWVIGTGVLLFVPFAIFQAIHYFTVFLL